jgi:mRNA interferase RelE/StbE
MAPRLMTLSGRTPIFRRKLPASDRGSSRRTFSPLGSGEEDADWWYEEKARAAWLAYRIGIQRSAEKELAALASTLQARIIKAIDGLAAEARPNGCRKLSEAKNAYRIRARKYRIIYEIYDEILVVIVIRVAHRREVHRD